MTVETLDKVSFASFNIAPTLLTALKDGGFIHPTPIQEKVIPIALAGDDVIGIAQTGTGKTLGFGVPMINRLMRENGQALIMVPTRELALQVHEVVEKIGRKLDIRCAVCIGGASFEKQRFQLNRNPQVIIATPGRLNDLIEKRYVSMSSISIVVLDEADRMFDIGFLPQIKKVLALVPKVRQTMLFSATMPREILALVHAHMNEPKQVSVAPAGTSSELIDQRLYNVRKDDKVRLLDLLLTDHPTGPVLIFSRTKHGAKKITKMVRDMGHSAVEIHSNRSLGQRTDAMRGFKNGQYRVLVATDIAARGIDVSGIALVVNFDLPDNPDDYVHRIGRTGRSGKNGIAVSFASPEDRNTVRQIERLIRKPLPVVPMPELPPARTASISPYAAKSYDDVDRGGHRGGSTGGRFGGSRSGGRSSFGGERKPFGARPTAPSRFNDSRPRFDASEKRTSPIRSSVPLVKTEYPTESAFPTSRMPSRPRFGSTGDRPQRSFSSDRAPRFGSKPSFGGERKSFGSGRPSFSGERKSFGSSRPSFGSRPSFRNDGEGASRSRGATYGERSPHSSAGSRPYEGSKPRKSFGSDRPSFGSSGPSRRTNFRSTRPSESDSFSHTSPRTRPAFKSRIAGSGRSTTRPSGGTKRIGGKAVRRGR
jgi:ATP-dependent RNA helicase RhlE